MDFVLELFFGIFLEAPLEAAMESGKLKPRVKTVLFLIVGNLVTALLVFAAVTTWREQGSRFGTIVLSLLSLGCVIFLVWAAIHGHRRGWKK